MARRNPEANKEKLLITLEKTMGIVTQACKEVGISRDRFYSYYNEDPEFKRRVDDINDIQLDFVESQLIKNISKGDKASIMFYMKYKGRKRGYAESHILEANIKVEQPLLKPLQDDDDTYNSDTQDTED